MPASEQIGIWREQLAEIGIDEACRLVAESGLRVSSLCRGGFLHQSPLRRRPLKQKTGKPSRRLQH
jgi:hypothetical protein